MYHPLTSVAGAVVAALACAAGPAATSLPSAAPTSSVTPVLLVLPIAAPAQGGREWIGKSIQQDLVADLTQVTRARVIAPASARPAADEQSALAAARDAGAGLVLYGQSQASGNQMRVTGQLLDVATGQPLAGLKATAPVDDLFPLEDSLAAQAAHNLPAALLLHPPSQFAGQPEGPQPYTSQTVQRPEYEPLPEHETEVAPAPYYSYSEPLPDAYYTYNTYYSPYPGWYYDQWPWWGGVGFYGGYGFGYWHDHDHDWGGDAHHPYYSSHLTPGFGGHTGLGRGPIGHEFGHYGIGGPGIPGHGFGGARPGFGGMGSHAAVGGGHGGAIGGGGGGHGGGGGGHSR